MTVLPHYLHFLLCYNKIRDPEVANTVVSDCANTGNGILELVFALMSTDIYCEHKLE